MTTHDFSIEIVELFTRAAKQAPCYWRIEKSEFIQLGLVNSAGTLDIELVLRRIGDYLSSSEFKGLDYFLYMDLGFSSTLTTFSAEDVRHLVSENHDIYVYAVKADESFFDIEGECYFAELDLQPTIKSAVLARSFRDREALAMGWEFSNGIYLRNANKGGGGN